jgi:hypothetical protein
MDVITELQNLLQINTDTAEAVRDAMDVAGFDYSECSQRQFNRVARNALDAVTAVRADMGVIA